MLLPSRGTRWQWPRLRSTACCPPTLRWVTLRVPAAALDRIFLAATLANKAGAIQHMPRPRDGVMPTERRWTPEELKAAEQEWTQRVFAEIDEMDEDGLTPDRVDAEWLAGRKLQCELTSLRSKKIEVRA